MCAEYPKSHPFLFLPSKDTFTPAHVLSSFVRQPGRSPPLIKLVILVFSPLSHLSVYIYKIKRRKPFIQKEKKKAYKE